MRTLLLTVVLSAAALAVAFAATLWLTEPDRPVEVIVPQAAGDSVATAGSEGDVHPALAPVVVDTTVVRYRVGGATADEILRAMADARTTGGPFLGLTQSESTFRFVPVVQSDGTCRLEDVQVALSVRTTLPAWTPPPGVDTRLRHDWSRFESALRRHEDRHRGFAVDGALRVQRAVDGLSGPSCEVLGLEARRIAEAVQAETEAQHETYDAVTDHGRTEGATWPLD